MYWMTTRKVLSYPSTVLSSSVVATDLVHEFVLGIDILDNATLNLAHGLAVIPKLAFKGQLERGGVGGIFAVC
jgi:hypothetical protein